MDWPKVAKTPVLQTFKYIVHISCLFAELETSFAHKRFPVQPVRLRYFYRKLLEKRPPVLLSENVSEK